MQDKTLLMIALVVAAIGLAALYLILTTADIPEVSFQELDEHTDQKIEIRATIERADAREKVTYLTVSQRQSIDAIIFDKVELQKGDSVILSGKWSDSEFIVEEIKNNT